MSYGDNWREARLRAGYGSPDQVVRTLAVVYPDDKSKWLSRSTIYELENDRSNPTVSTLQLLADTYGVQIADMFVLAGRTLSADHTPIELRPLIGPLSRIPQAQRESVVRNMAAHLSHLITILSGTNGNGEEAEEPHAQPA